MRRCPSTEMLCGFADTVDGNAMPELRTSLLQLHPALANHSSMQWPEDSTIREVVGQGLRPAPVSDPAAALAQLRDLQAAGQELISIAQVRDTDITAPVCGHVTCLAEVLHFAALRACRAHPDAVAVMVTCPSHVLICLLFVRPGWPWMCRASGTHGGGSSQ